MDARENATNEKRLIDANAFLKDILTAGIGKTIIKYSESDIGYMIRKRPTVDAVEVVRCRECKHFKIGEDNVYYCRRDKLGRGIFMRKSDFCSYGERKGGADNG